MKKSDSEIFNFIMAKEINIEFELLNYKLSVDNFDVSPYESLDMLDLRDILHKKLPLMSQEQRIELNRLDLKLLHNAKRMSEHLSSVYNFNYSKDISTNLWWWHLNDQSLIQNTILNKFEKVDE